MIYLIQSGEHYKIGVSKKPRERLRDLQTASPVKLILLKSFDMGDEDDYVHEYKLHKMFKTKKSSGEWFKLNSEDIEKISKTLKASKECCHYIDSMVKRQKKTARKREQQKKSRVSIKLIDGNIDVNLFTHDEAFCFF